MPRIIAALISYDYIRALSKDIYYLAFTLISPLRSDHDCARHKNSLED